MHGYAISAKDAQRRRPALALTVALLALLTLTAGCRSLSLPRIDPTGQGVFAPGSTALDPQLGQLPTPQPAFVGPAPVPPCNGPQCKKQHIKLNCDKLCDGIRRELTCVGDEGQLMVTPASVIAPVGSEVIVLAGLCGPDRNFVARQPIEFMLSQESVGNFVAVGEDGASFVTRLYRDQPKKTDTGYVVGLSSASEQLVTRGTLQTTDDIHLGKGQTWLSVTSPSEGTSYITVLAPKAKNWDQRRQTAVIHWVDAQWQLPGPAIVPAGRRHKLTTVVRRAGGAVPASGWIVRYEVSGGETAGFGPQMQPVAEVPVDPSGAASVDIQQSAAAPGTTLVSIKILRPGLIGASPMAVGEGATSVTWSAPGLAVRVNGPETMQAGTEATFRIEVSNPGDIASRDVVVTTMLPPSLEFAGANPPPQQLGERLEWRLDQVGAKAVRVIEMKAAAVRGGSIRLVAQATSADGVQARGELASRVSQPSLTMRIVGPQTAFVGEAATFRIELDNIGDQILSNVRVLARFDAGLEHDKGQRSPLEWPGIELQPRQKQELGLTFIVRQEGDLKLNIEASADGAELVVGQAVVRAAVKEVSSLQVIKGGPGEVVVGTTAEYTIEVTNNGNKPLTNVRIVDRYPASMTPTAANPGFTFEGGAIVWAIPTLEPNVRVTRKVACQALRVDDAINRVTVTTNEGVSGEDDIMTRIVAGGPMFAPPMRVPVGDAAPAKGDESAGGESLRRSEPVGGESLRRSTDAKKEPVGELRLSLRASTGAARVGDVVTYSLSLENARDVSDRQARVRITLPPGLAYVRFRGRVAGAPVGEEKRVVDLTPIAELRANELIDGLTLEARAVAAGPQRIVAEAVSELQTTGAKAETVTAVQ